MLELRRGVRRAATRTTEGASTGADSISSTHISKGIGSGRAVARVLEANLQHFLECEGIAFINERPKVAVGALLSSRGGKMKSHKRSKSLTLSRSWTMSFLRGAARAAHTGLRAGPLRS